MFKSAGRGTAEMPFLEHLEELRWRILKSIIAVVVGSVAGWFIVTRFGVLELLVRPLVPFLDGSKLNYLSPGDPFLITLKLALTVGLLLAFPIIIGQIWAFVAPALHPREKRAIVPALYLGLVLFLAGVALAYFLVLPMTLKFFYTIGAQQGMLQAQIVAGPYLALVVKILLAFGVVFELPVVVLVLSALGLITSKFLVSKRRFAVAGSAILGAMLSPGDAITVTVFMMGPLLVLYELSIGLARLVERRREKALASEPLAEAS